MELLIIKAGDRYLRFKEEQILEVGLDKASVFPMDRLDHVRTLEQLAATRLNNTVIKKLILTEENL